ncbi:MAG TPA: TMEM175 family protein [Roseiflexaceae bacterium]|nr:TMEM175 family protein [Roseiflexaceae bacterium]
MGLRAESNEAKETGRIEAFSDGVIAIAITLLVLDIKVPRDLPEAASLLGALLAQWPSYFAFATSFATIGIMWINHHRLFDLIKRADQMLLVLNGLLLMCITVVPFPTSLLAEYLGEPQDRTAALVYSGTFFVTAIVFNVLWRYASHKNRLIDPRSDPAVVRGISRQYAFGPLVYLAAFILAFFSATASLALTMLLALFFAIPASRLGSAPRA